MNDTNDGINHCECCYVGRLSPDERALLEADLDWLASNDEQDKHWMEVFISVMELLRLKLIIQGEDDEHDDKSVGDTPCEQTDVCTACHNSQVCHLYSQFAFIDDGYYRVALPFCEECVPLDGEPVCHDSPYR
uniref:Uncharacterized protein n=1 Tax=viral metagenome TaxID=1070528 RepID=A0A2V0RM85_9ZZZZ